MEYRSGNLWLLTHNQPRGLGEKGRGWHGRVQREIGRSGLWFGLSVRECMTCHQ